MECTVCHKSFKQKKGLHRLHISNGVKRRFNYPIVKYMNEILHYFNIHLESYDEFQMNQLRMIKASKNVKKAKHKNRLFRDILSGMKKKELMILYDNVKRIDKIIDSFLPLENIFIPILLNDEQIQEDDIVTART